MEPGSAGNAQGKPSPGLGTALRQAWRHRAFPARRERCTAPAGQEMAPGPAAAIPRSAVSRGHSGDTPGPVPRAGPAALPRPPAPPAGQRLPRHRAAPARPAGSRRLRSAERREGAFGMKSLRLSPSIQPCHRYAYGDTAQSHQLTASVPLLSLSEDMTR